MQVQVTVGDQVYVSEGGEEIGAIRAVEPMHLVVYVENGGDFVVPARAVVAVHDHKVVLDPAQLEPAMQSAIRHAHDLETL